MISSAEITRLFRTAEYIDPTISLTPHALPRLSDLMINVDRYNRHHLFKNMALGKISIFEDFPSPLKTCKQRNLTNPTALILEALHNADIDHLIRTKSGKKGSWKYFTLAQLAEKWQRKKAIINVTDLHFRNTSLENVINAKRLSQFNLYPCATAHTNWLEMMTLVVSSNAAISDSHSDDSDGSNHCFTGKKLWLAWDTNEGIANGLEDLDRQKIEGKCAFNMEVWLALKSACWFTIEAGQTLFMPGHLTHKVLTIEPYLGVGSFYLALPNLLTTLTRWLTYSSNWEKLERAGYQNLVYADLLKTAVKQLNILRRASENTRLIWGLDYFKYAITAWQQHTPKAHQEKLLKQVDLCELGVTS